MALLSDDEIRDRLPEGWTHEGTAIRKQFEFETFPTGIAFVNLLADAAEEAGHHPDVDIRYNKIRVALTTHSDGGVTEKDLSLAAEADTLAEAAGRD